MEIGKFNLIKTEGRARRGEFCTAHGVVQTPVFQNVGTAGAIKNAGKYVTDKQFFVLNGDTFYQMDFGDLSRIQQEKNLEMALVLRGVPDISRYGAARLTDGLLTAFNEKNGNTGAGTINGGVYLMKRALLDEIPEGKVSLENECIPRWMQADYTSEMVRPNFRTENFCVFYSCRFFGFGLIATPRLMSPCKFLPNW